MKKIIFCAALLVSFSFCGCKLISGLFGNNGTEENEQITTVSVDASGEIYLVKLNNTSRVVRAKNTGYVKDSSRAAEDSVEPAVTDDDKVYYDTDMFIRNLNSKINESVANYCSDKSRAGEGEEPVIETGYSTKNYGNTEQFWSYTSIKKGGVLGTQEINVPGKINAVKKYTGEHCYVYADTANSNAASKGINISDEIYTTLGEKFDSCYELETAILGDPKYNSYNAKFFVPCNQKIIILVSDLFGDATPNQDSGTVGYFYSGDMYNQTFLDNTTGLNKGKTSDSDDFIHSNECEMFYIDACFLSSNELRDTVYSTLVHEFNHMINYVVKTVNYMAIHTSINSIRSCDTWYTEMLSMTTEDMFQKYLGLDDKHSPKARLPYFAMAYYYGFTNWDNNKVDPILCYANTYAFGAFLVRNFGGLDLLKEIAQNNYVNEESITKALQKLNPNITYTDSKTNETKKIDFEYALRSFPMCVIFTDSREEYSLFKSVEYKNGLGFDAISLGGEVTIEGKTYQTPFTFFSGKDGQIDIYPTGFTVHRVGTNIKSFKLATPENPTLTYFKVVK